MSPLRLSDADAAALRAMVLLQRYTLRLTRVTEEWLGEGSTDNTDLQVLLAVWRLPEPGPSEIMAAVRIPRSTLARALSRLLERGLVERRPHPGDRRRATLHVTSRGRDGITRYEHALTDFFAEAEPVIKEVLLLLGHQPPPSTSHAPRPDVLLVAEQMTTAGSAFVREVLPRLRPYGVAEVADRFALMELAQAWSRPSWLAEDLGLSPAGTTSLLERLESAGLVVREAGGLDSDRRAVVVHLTSRGRRAARTLLTVFMAHQDDLARALAPTIGYSAHPTPAE